MGTSCSKRRVTITEAQIIDEDDPFLKNGLNLAIDGQSADYIRDVLSKNDAMKKDIKRVQVFSL